MAFNIYERDLEKEDPTYEELLEYHSFNEKELDKSIRAAIQEAKPYNFDSKIVTDKGNEKYIHIEGIPHQDDNGEVTELHGIVQDITKRTKAEIERTETQQKLTNITHNINGLILRYKLYPDGSDDVLFISEGVEKVHELSREEVLESSDVLWSNVVAEDREDLRKSIQESAKDLSVWNNRWRIKTPKGNLKYIQAYGTPHENSDGSVIWDTLQLDITEKVQTQIDNEVLLKEVHHRVKNNLAIISGLLELELDEIPDEKHTLPIRRSLNRIYAIGAVHELLYKSSSFANVQIDEYLKKLTKAVTNTFPLRENIQISLEVDQLSMNLNEAIPLGMLLNELLTNSYKYAYDESEQGKIDIDITEKSDSYKVSYQDYGRGFDRQEVEESKTLGMTIVQMLLKQLDAEYQFETQEGFSISLLFDKKEVGSHSNI